MYIYVCVCVCVGVCVHIYIVCPIVIDGAVAAALCNQDPLMYQYAKVEGTRAWREALAGFLRGQGATKLTADHICASFGNSLALASIAKTADQHQRHFNLPGLLVDTVA